MYRNTFKTYIQDILAQADVQINGDRAWDIQIHNEKLYQIVAIYEPLAIAKYYLCIWKVGVSALKMSLKNQQK